jgi:hypothetical protein
MSELQKDEKKNKAEETEKNIESTLEYLTHLLEKKKAAEATQTSLVTNCESAGAGLRPCDPLMPGHCPPEDDFETTFKGMEWADVWTKDAKTGKMMRCTPEYLQGRPSPGQARTRDTMRLEERLLRAMHIFEGNYHKLIDASEWQHITPCEDATNEEQCGIMRDPPKINQQTGSREFQEHGTRCYWAPTQDPSFLTNAKETPTKMCRPFHESPYKPIPMDQAYISQVKANLKSAATDAIKAGAKQSVENLTLMDPYDRVRTRLSPDHYRDLNKSYVQMSLFPISEVLAATAVAAAQHHTFRSILDEHRRKKGGGEEDTTVTNQTAVSTAIMTITPNLSAYIYDNPNGKDKYSEQKTGAVGDILNEEDGETYLRTSNQEVKDTLNTYKTQADVIGTVQTAVDKQASLTFNYAALKRKIKEVKDLQLCDESTDKGKSPNNYVWNFADTFGKDGEDTQKKLKKLNQNGFFLTTMLPAEFAPNDALGLAKNKDGHYAKVAKRDLWKFTHAALTSQAVFQAEFLGLVERIHGELKNKKLLSKLMIKRTEQEGPADEKKNVAVYDLTALRGLWDAGSEAMKALIDTNKFDDLARKADASNLTTVLTTGQDLQRVQFGASADPEKQKSASEMAASLTVVGNKENGEQAVNEWKLAVEMARAMVESSYKGLGKSGDGEQTKPVYAKALHLAGLGNNPKLRWRAKVGAEVHVANFDNANETDTERRNRIQASVARIERLQVANELKSALQKELLHKRGNRIMMAVQTSLENARTPEQRYERAISFIPTLLAHGKDKDGEEGGVEVLEVFNMADREIKRRFNTPPHPLFYNEKTTNSRWKPAGLDSQCQKDEPGAVTLSQELACRYIKEAEVAANVAKEKADSAEDIGKKVVDLLGKSRTSMTADRYRTNLAEALSLEEKYGSESFIDVKNKTYLPMRTIEQRAERMERPF